MGGNLKQESSLTESPHRQNLMILVFIWCTLSFSYFNVGFVLKYLQGDLFKNVYASSISEIIAKASSSFILLYVGLKPLFGITFGLTLIGSLALIFLGSENEFLVSAMVLVAKFGISVGWVGAYMGPILLFPTTIVSTGIGICNVLARASAMLAPIVAEQRAPIPMVSIAILAPIAFMLSLSLHTKSTAKI